MIHWSHPVVISMPKIPFCRRRSPVLQPLYLWCQGFGSKLTPLSDVLVHPVVSMFGETIQKSTAVQPQWRYVWYAGLCLELCTSGPLLTMARCGDAEVLTNGRGVSARIMRPVSVQASGTLKLQKHTSLFGCPYCITWQFCLHASWKKYLDHVLLSATEFQSTPFQYATLYCLGPSYWAKIP